MENCNPVVVPYLMINRTSRF